VFRNSQLSTAYKNHEGEHCDCTEVGSSDGQLGHNSAHAATMNRNGG
jgi:hypothetical protein